MSNVTKIAKPDRGYLAQRIDAYNLGYADGKAKHLRPAHEVAEAVGYSLPAPTSDGYPYDLARCYLQGHTAGQAALR